MSFKGPFHNGALSVVYAAMAGAREVIDLTLHDDVDRRWGAASASAACRRSRAGAAAIDLTGDDDDVVFVEERVRCSQACAQTGLPGWLLAGATRKATAASCLPATASSRSAAGRPASPPVLIAPPLSSYTHLHTAQPSKRALSHQVGQGPSRSLKTTLSSLVLRLTKKGQPSAIMHLVDEEARGVSGQR